nr:MAG TPA: hypothetical protein [Caudoviricetes sp.]
MLSFSCAAYRLPPCSNCFLITLQRYDFFL